MNFSAPELSPNSDAWCLGLSTAWSGLQLELEILERPRSLWSSTLALLSPASAWAVPIPLCPAPKVLPTLFPVSLNPTDFLPAPLDYNLSPHSALAGRHDRTDVPTSCDVSKGQFSSVLLSISPPGMVPDMQQELTFFWLVLRVFLE